MSSSNSQQAPGQNKTTMIVVNGRQREFVGHSISYEQVVVLAYPGEVPGGEITVYTVSYANPHGKNGTLAAHQNVQVQEGMVFNVTKTNRS